MTGQRAKGLRDPFGVIRSAVKDLPDDAHRLSFLRALAELEDNECHKHRNFPVTRLHRVTGVAEAVYRADIDKISGWRLHCQYVEGFIQLSDVVAGGAHDRPIDVIRTKKGRYTVK